MSIVHMNTKIIQINDRHFTLIYLNESNDLNSLKNELDIVSVRYFPKPDETAKDCKQLFKESTPEILNAVKNVVENNQNFFQNFEIGMKFIANRSHYRDKALIDYTFYLDTKLKTRRN
ncbi:hypothetical protein [Flavobacterium macacae]|uniref:Uncharacterized protein n=1 Tax=Flavobacterium macacae TaxID=2488993 RepID=A0A3P3WDY6_9FLAO|nr:hypothetical protein [Flavobacterium macacae]RRJ92577.1 hypothetical protein EG849_06230 [Flavobacterium macacae]